MQMSRLRRKQFIVSHEMNKQMARNSIEIKFIKKNKQKSTIGTTGKRKPKQIFKFWRQFELI